MGDTMDTENTLPDLENEQTLDVRKTSKKEEKESRKAAEERCTATFIEEIHAQTIIWKKEEKEHKNVYAVTKCYETILANMTKQFPGSVLASANLDTVTKLRSKFKTIKDAHIRYQ
jgi:hypothetical protein